VSVLAAYRSQVKGGSNLKQSIEKLVINLRRYGFEPRHGLTRCDRHFCIGRVR
jgi:hypothetical protein